MKQKNTSIIIRLLIIVVTLIVLSFSFYKYLLFPVSTSKEVLTFEVEKGSTITDISKELKKEGLIKSVTAFKIYVNQSGFSNFQAGYYELSPSMSSEDIAYKIHVGDALLPNVIVVNFPEGKNLDQMAQILANNTIYSKKEILEIWNSKKFIDFAIDKFWFISNEVYNKDIIFSLNGYFFADTYFFKDKEVTPEEAGLKMLSQMDKVLSNYKNKIQESDLSVHEIITFASIIEYEAITDQDRSMIAGVFYNRLKKGMKLQSCATLDMALGTHKLRYTIEDTQVQSPYNTYYIYGLPIGPGNSPSKKSIEVALNPASHNYYYFMSDIYNDNKTYYAKTLREHNNNVNKYLNR